MADLHLSIRLDLANGERIGPGKVALLEAIKETGSISAAARKMDMSYRRAWLLVEAINRSLRKPAVTSEVGGQHGGGAKITSVGEHIIALYREIEAQSRTAAKEQFRAIAGLARSAGKAAS